MGEIVLVIGLLLVGGASLFASYKGWRALQANPPLMGRALRESAANLRPTRIGSAWLIFLVVAGLAGATGGVLLAMEVQDGKDHHFQQGER